MKGKGGIKVYGAGEMPEGNADRRKCLPVQGVRRHPLPLFFSFIYLAGPGLSFAIWDLVP